MTSSPTSPHPQLHPHPHLLTTRLTIPHFLYFSNPTKCIKQLLGHNITIHSFTSNDIITSNDDVIVDVQYTSLPLSILTIYYIPTSSLKKLLPDSEKYATTINGCNIKISHPRIKDFPNIIPIRVKPTLSNNYSSNAQLDTQFSYYGSTVTNPMNSLCTPLKYMNHAFEPFYVDPVTPIYTPEFKSTYDLKSKQFFNDLLQVTITSYKQSIPAFPILSSVDNVKSVSSFSECKLGTTAYILPFSSIPITASSPLHGVILIQPKRIPQYVLFYPTKNFTICEEELLSIKDFLDQDEINYINFNYAMNVLNKSS